MLAFVGWVDPPEDNISVRAQPNLPKTGLFVQALIGTFSVICAYLSIETGYSFLVQSGSSLKPFTYG
jgi:hypothetical protein